MSVREHDNGINNERRVFLEKERRKEGKKKGKRWEESKRYFQTRIPLEIKYKPP